MSRFGRRPVLFAGVGAGATLALLAAAVLPGAAGSAASASTAKAANGTPVTVGSAALGLDVGPWDTLYSDAADLNMMQTYLKAAGIDQLHYGGGGFADQYDWENNTAVNNSNTCGPAPTAAAFGTTCAVSQPFDFDQFSANAQGLGAQSLVTVNYGSGTPKMAAAWVTHSVESGESVAQWDIGNESYGCWEYDTWLTGDPLDDVDYQANDSAVCPWNLAASQAAGVTDMAQSFVDNALPYMEEMTAADPSIQIGVPWAFDGSVGGAGVPNNASWDETLLEGLDTAETHVSFVEAHWYPFSFGGAMSTSTKTAQQVIQSVENIPSEYGKMRTILTAGGDPGASVVIGETGVSYLATNVPCTPTGALFAAGDVLEWLAAGAQTVDWWPMETGENAGTACTLPEEGMFTGNGTPDSVYTGYLLASELAHPNARLSTLSVSNRSNPSDTVDTFGFQSALPDGQTVVALINANTSAAQKVSISSSLNGNLATQTYSAGNQNGSNSLITTGATTSAAIAGGITLPAQSIVILKSALPSKVTVGAAAATVKAGAKVAVSGNLTLNGATAPAGTTVKIYRRAVGSSVNLATLTTTTTAGGAFAATDIPAKYGHYDYVASYGGSGSYQPSSAATAVHVTALQPTLRLKFSAGSVKPGKKVTVTATLTGWHNNHTLVIYAQPKGSAKKVIARASTTAKGVLAVTFTVKVNTTFTVTYGGDYWYGTATVSGIVKA